ncbi:MAG: UDP-4-amino-4,6-dideoxy-N-acetyl-beta-L-altrosamine transaminase, partial [Candidatus Marinimicrobia bacterium]|nr:UDP-4-amino-4,6-dideoxy-N-acetyl-beta-L-altrosamine transaminase [Candidatus Neomarinimicrobiota bacterium]
LDSFIQKRCELAKYYDGSFSNIENLIIPIVQRDVEHSYHLYPLQIDFEKMSLTKVNFFEKMKKAGINLQVHYIPIHLQPFYKKNYGFQQGDFPISERFYQNELSLPIYPDLSDKNVSLVIDSILEIIPT